MAAKKTAKKAVSKKAPVKKSFEAQTATTAPSQEATVETKLAAAAPKKKGSVAFYFPRENPAFTVTDDSGKLLRIKGINKTLVLSEGKDDFAIKMLRADAGNKANGGSRFAEIAVGQLDSVQMGDRLDDLMGLDDTALVAMAGGEFYMYQLSKGNLIAKILEL